jgi:hypothetical protein
MTHLRRAFRLGFVALLTAACVAIQPAPTQVPQTLAPTAGTTAEPAPTFNPAPMPPTSAPTVTAVPQPSPSFSPAAVPKAVFIVGPTDAMTDGLLASAEAMAMQAESAGMEVRRVFFPNATWKNVLAEAQGASLVAYFGHGYGWPSNTARLNEGQQDGMGLNSYDGSGPLEVKYYGATRIRESIRLAPHAVVMLMNGCYTSGNGLWGTPIPDQDLARQRVDNYASGWLAAGAGAVFAFQWGTRFDFAAALMNTDATVDELFMAPRREYVGANDLYFASQRTSGAVSHLDPDPDHGYLRAVTGDLAMTTAMWRSGAG